jgi:hypothetical protein
MDQQLRKRLIEKIKEIGLPFSKGSALPLVSLEDFFTGNDDLGSIGCNLVNHPGIPAFYERLKQIRERPDVQNVMVGVYEVEEEDPSMWPFSELIYIVTTASKAEVENWVEELEPDEIEEGYFLEAPFNPPTVPLGYKLYNVWWD